MSNYDPTLFEGAAPYYARFRPAYPPSLVQLLCAECGLDGTGRLLDLGCGTGHLTLPLAPLFQEAVGVEPDPEMLREADRLARQRDVRTVQWVRGVGEDLPPSLGAFRLVTIASAWHWMDREAVLARVAESLLPGGFLAIVGGGNPASDMASRTPVGVAISEAQERWLGPVRRAGRGTFSHPEERHEQLISRCWSIEPSVSYLPWPQEWDVDRLIGFLYSTSFASRRLLGPNTEAFERDVRQAILSVEPSGRWTSDQTVEVILARR